MRFIRIRSINLIAFAIGGWAAQANDCPSMLRQALQPAGGESNLQWATEVTLKAGQTTGGGDPDKNFNNEMLLLGLQYQVSPVFRFYVEGGFKYWNKTGPDNGGGAGQGAGACKNDNCPTVEGNWSSKSHAGFRELYAEYTPESSAARAGLQTMTAGDPLLLDERVLGLYASHDVRDFRLQGGVGTVSYTFARNGEFCASRHNYRALYPYWQRELSDDLWKNNLAFLTLSWFPGRTSAPDEDEFESLEFSAAPVWKVNEVGATFFRQFGDGFSNDTSYAAAFVRNTLPFVIHLNLEIVGQFGDDQDVVAYWVAADKSVRFDAAGTTALRGGYLGVSGKTDEKRFEPMFDNLNLGDAIRMDALDAPLFFGEISHTIPFAWPLILGALYVAQTEDEKVRETDLSATLRPRLPLSNDWKWVTDNFTVGAIYSRVDADDLEEPVNTWRIELRWAL